MRAGVVLFCDKCGVGREYVGAVPVVCADCREVTTYSTRPPYHLSEMDSRFLKSIHITHTKD